MGQEPFHPFPDDEDELGKGRRARRGFAIDLTGMGVRIAATAIVLGLSLVLIFLAIRPGTGEQPLDAIPPVDDQQGENLPQVLATFTPGPTSTPPPLDEPTQVPSTTGEEGAPSGTLEAGAAAVVSGTGGLGVNMRDGPSTGNAVIQVLSDETPVTIVEGPQEAEGFAWWKVRLEDETEGWLVQDFLAPR